MLDTPGSTAGPLVHNFISLFLTVSIFLIQALVALYPLHYEHSSRESLENNTMEEYIWAQGLYRSRYSH